MALALQAEKEEFLVLDTMSPWDLPRVCEYLQAASCPGTREGIGCLQPGLLEAEESAQCPGVSRGCPGLLYRCLRTGLPSSLWSLCPLTPWSPQEEGLQ